MTTPVTHSLDTAGARIKGWWLAASTRQSDRAWVPPAWVAVASVLVAAAIHASVAWGSIGPIFGPDEIGTMGNGRVIADSGQNWSLIGNGYMPGVGLMLAPVWALTDDPFVVYQVALALGVATAVLSIWPLSNVARWAGASASGAVVIAAVISLAPARTIPSNYVMSENLLILVTASAVALAIRVLRSPTLLNAALFGLVAGAAPLAHGRGATVALACGLWCVWWLWRRAAVGLVAGIIATSVSAASYLLYRWITARLYYGDDRVADVLSGSESRTWEDVIASLAGVSWYAVAAWPAVAALGVLLLARRLRHDPIAWLVTGITTLAIVLTLTQMQRSPSEGPFTRLDTWFYGRYAEQAFVLLAVIGAAALVRVRWAALSAAVVLITAAVSIVFLVLTVPRMPVGGYFIDIHVPGVSHYLSLDTIIAGESEPWALICGATVLVALLVVIASWVRSAGILVLALYWGALSLANDATRIDPRDDYYRETAALGEASAYLPADVTVGADITYAEGTNFYVFWNTPRRLTLIAVGEGLPHPDVVLTTIGNPVPAQAGAKLLPEGDYAGLGYWIYPGDLQDSLSEAGLLVDAPTPAG
ncbi:hypothetical protein [Demequina activiva]|uniref:Uncharacterized protein n=1 Tax=Demequina activiva TaxID=1582364 RepID=A0A919Q5G3_9MICO|nr:hypothetical protein [Demequina activiva]GIG54618.1 hypothetical protein Dac01nite_13700 [Demequina activiva]